MRRQWIGVGVVFSAVSLLTVSCSQPAVPTIASGVAPDPHLSLDGRESGTAHPYCVRGGGQRLYRWLVRGCRRPALLHEIVLLRRAAVEQRGVELRNRLAGRGTAPARTDSDNLCHRRCGIHTVSGHGGVRGRNTVPQSSGDD